MTKLASFNSGQSINTSIAAAGATFGAASNAITSAGKLGSALSNAFNSPGGVSSALRSINLPAAGEAIGDIVSAVSMFGGDDADPNDWRVRLSLPNWVSFKNSPALKPLKDAGGLIFPYTPSVQIKGKASYTGIQTTHTNFTFQGYQRSEPDEIQISAPMYVEDTDQALYWIAMVHYLRSASKMFAGNDPKAGNPPPIVFLNGYGNYVFKNVPVVITSYNVDIKNDCDFIGTEVSGSTASGIATIADNIGGLADQVGSALPGLSSVTGAISDVTNVGSQIGGMLGSFGVGGTTSGGRAYAPVSSTVTVAVRAVYSRENSRKFSLDQFVTGGYINNYFNYI